MNEQLRISTVLANGTKVDYNVILTFKSVINGNNYVVYTDNTYDQNKKIRFWLNDKILTFNIEKSPGSTWTG